MNQVRTRIRKWAMSKADREALEQVTARLKPAKPAPHPGKITPISVFASAAWAKAVTAQTQGKSFFANFIATESNNLSGRAIAARMEAAAARMEAAEQGLTLDKLRRAAAFFAEHGRPSPLIFDDVVEFVGPPTKQQVLAEVTARLKPPKPRAWTTDDQTDAMRYAFSSGAWALPVAKPENVIQATSCAA